MPAKVTAAAPSSTVMNKSVSFLGVEAAVVLVVPGFSLTCLTIFHGSQNTFLMFK